jgi:exosortase
MGDKILGDTVANRLHLMTLTLATPVAPLAFFRHVGAKDVVAGLLAAAAGVFVTIDAWQDIVKTARLDEESSHILLVPIAMLWIAWGSRSRLSGCRRTGCWLGPIVALMGGALYLYGVLGWARTITYVGAIVVVLGCFLSVVGVDLLRRFWPVFVALIFLVPVPGVLRQQIAAPLGSWTARATEELLLVLSLPVERSGNLLSINQVDVTIAEACNGLRMVLSLFFVSYVVAFERPAKWYIRMAVLTASPVTAILCNIVRLVPTLCIYGYGSRDWADQFHDFSGWVMLIMAYFALMGLIKLLEWTFGSWKSNTTVAN